MYNHKDSLFEYAFSKQTIQARSNLSVGGLNMLIYVEITGPHTTWASTYSPKTSRSIMIIW